VSDERKRQGLALFDRAMKKCALIEAQQKRVRAGLGEREGRRCFELAEQRAERAFAQVAIELERARIEVAQLRGELGLNIDRRTGAHGLGELAVEEHAHDLFLRCQAHLGNARLSRAKLSDTSSGWFFSHS